MKSLFHQSLAENNCDCRCSDRFSGCIDNGFVVSLIRWSRASAVNDAASLPLPEKRSGVENFITSGVNCDCKI